MSDGRPTSTDALSVLVVDDQASIRVSLRDALSDAGVRVSTAETGEEALSTLEEQPFDLTISDIRLPGMSGIELMARIQQQGIDTKVVLITAYDHIGQALTAIKMGALAYITKPFSPEQILQLMRSNFRLEQKPSPLRQIPCKSRLWTSVVDLSEALALTDHNLMIVGEIGTGRKKMAEAIHQRSRRRDFPQVNLPCSAIPAALAGSDFLGQIRHRIVAARAGTLVLEEVDGLRPGMQAELIRALEENTPSTETRGNRSGVRILATATMDLAAMVETDRFRSDLHLLLAPAQINIPPLRERREDIQMLIEYYLARHRGATTAPCAGFSEPALEALLGYDYPGNIGELEHIVEVACHLSEATGSIKASALPAPVRTHQP